MLPGLASACSAVACVDSGPEFRSDFQIAVKHAGKPLKGALIEITAATGNPGTVRFSGVTGPNGIVRIAALPAGDYWLSAKLLGISAAYHCFHVARHPSFRAKRRVRYEWGEFYAETRSVSGRLIDSLPGTGENPLLNMIHRITPPIRKSALRLQNPLTGAVFTTTSDDSGAFEFPAVPAGLYVLHVEGGMSNRPFDATSDHLLRVSPNAKADGMELTRRDPAGGSCGGVELNLVIRRGAT